MTAKSIFRACSAVLMAAAFAFFCGCSREEQPAAAEKKGAKTAVDKRSEDKVYVHKLGEFRSRQAKDASAVAAVRRQIAALGKDAPQTKPEYAALTNRLAQLEAAQRQTNKTAADAIRARILQDAGRAKPSAKPAK